MSTDRLDRIESSLAISQLPSRYAMALDARDLDALVALFVDDVEAGEHGLGREALKRWYDGVLRRYRSIHLICGHEFDLLDADHATGSIYCRAEPSTKTGMGGTSSRCAMTMCMSDAMVGGTSSSVVNIHGTPRT
jgi:hypothetical protein